MKYLEANACDQIQGYCNGVVNGFTSWFSALCVFWASHRCMGASLYIAGLLPPNGIIIIGIALICPMLTEVRKLDLK
jgi:hypothetical protein